MTTEASTPRLAEIQRFLEAPGHFIAFQFIVVLALAVVRGTGKTFSNLSLQLCLAVINSCVGVALLVFTRRKAVPLGFLFALYVFTVIIQTLAWANSPMLPE